MLVKIWHMCQQKFLGIAPKSNKKVYISQCPCNYLYRHTVQTRKQFITQSPPSKCVVSCCKNIIMARKHVCDCVHRTFASLSLSVNPVKEANTVSQSRRNNMIIKKYEKLATQDTDMYRAQNCLTTESSFLLKLRELSA